MLFSLSNHFDWKIIRKLQILGGALAMKKWGRHFFFFSQFWTFLCRDFRDEGQHST